MLSVEQMADVQQQRQRSLEVGTILDAASHRVSNRLYDRRKSTFVRDFLETGRAGEYPNIEEDRRGDNGFDLGAHFGQRLECALVAVLEPVLGKTMVSATVLASEILESELDGNLGTLRSLPPRQVTVPLVLAHVAALGYPLGKRLTMQVAVRTTLVLLNSARFA